MWMFREELKTTKASHKKLKVRMRTLRRYMLQHYVLLIISLIQNGIALFIVVNYSGPYRAALFVFLLISVVVGMFLLFSGLSK